MLNYSTIQPGGLGLHAAYYVGGSGFEVLPGVTTHVVETIDPKLSFSWPTGYVVPTTDPSEVAMRKAVQFVRWDGYVLSPRSDLFTFFIEADRIKTAMYIDKTLVWDSELNYQAPITLQVGSTYEVALEARINPLVAEAGALDMKVLWETPRAKKSILSGFFLYDSAEDVVFSPFPVSVT